MTVTASLPTRAALSAGAPAWCGTVEGPGEVPEVMSRGVMRQTEREGGGRRWSNLRARTEREKPRPIRFRQFCMQNRMARPRTRPLIALYSSVPLDQPLENEMTITIEYCTV